MDSSTLAGQFSQYAITHHKADIVNILKNPHQNQHFSVIVNFVTLYEENVDLGQGLLLESEKYLSICDQGSVMAQRNIMLQLQHDCQETLQIKTKVHIRLTALPTYPQLHRTVFPRNDDVSNFLTVAGTLVKVTSPKLLEYQRDYICSKCHNAVTVQADYDLHYILTPPSKCSNDCSGTNFKPVKIPDPCNYKDYQEIKIQEQVEKLNIGNMPQSMWVTLEDDLVDTGKPGDNVVVCGTVMRRWKPPNIDTKCDIEVVLKANNLQVCNDQKSSTLITEEVMESFKAFWEFYKNDDLSGRNHILSSFCPQVYGLYLVKLAIAVVLAGGVHHADETGSGVRGESHLLLVGDPGTGKSHLLRFASRVCPRSVLTTGVGSTSAGLTVSAVREGSDWQLEAGALVLADGGICCIDEFNSIREHDRTSIHEAMEQQTISVAKAGMVTKLNARCSILAATNPKGNYDSEKRMSVNLAVASPLLSRFDLVLILLDSRNPEWDKLLSGFILSGGKDTVVSQETHTTLSVQELITEIWPVDHLQSYFCLIRSLNPVLTKEANMVLCKYYQAQRIADSRNVARTTVRMLESLVRLSQGHARLMLRKKVTVQDAIVAVSLIESSMQSSALIAGINALHTAFPEDPCREYKLQAELVLKKLKIDDILHQELSRLEKLNDLEDGVSNITAIAATVDIRNVTFETQEKVQEKPFKVTSMDFSQKITEILSGIRKTKGKNMYEAMKHAKYNRPKTKRKKTSSKLLPNNKKTKISDSESEGENDANQKDTRSDSEGRSCIFTDSSENEIKDKNYSSTPKTKIGSRKDDDGLFEIEDDLGRRTKGEILDGKESTIKSSLSSFNFKKKEKPHECNSSTDIIWRK